MSGKGRTQRVPWMGGHEVRTRAKKLRPLLCSLHSPPGTVAAVHEPLGQEGGRVFSKEYE